MAGNVMAGVGSGPVVGAAIVLVATVAGSAAAGAPVTGLVAGLCAAVAAGAVLALMARPAVVGPPPAAVTGLAEAVAANAQLRHDLRGALSPALLVSDRLTGHADPAVAKAGNIVVRAVERATGLLEQNKSEDAARSLAAGSGGALTPPVR